MKKIKMTRIIAYLFSVFSILTLISIKANAEWKEDSTGWWYENNSSWIVGWKQIDNEWYFFDDNGYMKTGWIKSGDKWYYLNSNGSMAKNTTVEGYTLDENGAWVTAQDIREIIYNQLTTDDKNRIVGTWKDGKVSEIKSEDGIGIINDKTYIGKEIYLIEFPTNPEIKPDSMIVFAPKDTQKLIGYAYIK